MSDIAKIGKALMLLNSACKSAGLKPPEAITFHRSDYEKIQEKMADDKNSNLIKLGDTSPTELQIMGVKILKGKQARLDRLVEEAKELGLKTPVSRFGGQIQKAAKYCDPAPGSKTKTLGDLQSLCREQIISKLGFSARTADDLEHLLGRHGGSLRDIRNTPLMAPASDSWNFCGRLMDGPNTGLIVRYRHPKVDIFDIGGGIWSYVFCNKHDYAKDYLATTTYTYRTINLKGKEKQGIWAMEQTSDAEAGKLYDEWIAEDPCQPSPD